MPAATAATSGGSASCGSTRTIADHLFAADVSLRESTDGGAHWHVSGDVHADQHAMQWDPNVADRIYLGNDGGVYHSDGNGADGTWVHATYEPMNQSYHLAVATDDPKRLATGLQDNGSVRTWTATHEPTNLNLWNAYGGGDGHEVQIDYRDHNTYYECSQVGYCTLHQDVNGRTTSHPFGTAALDASYDRRAARARSDQSERRLRRRQRARPLDRSRAHLHPDQPVTATT